jgi:lipopolysaccharide biosynthesis regulator YciM
MKIRTVLYLMIGAIVVAVLSIVYNSNRDILNRQIFLSDRLSMPVWFCFLMVSGVSMLVPLLLGMLRDLRRMFSGFTARRLMQSKQEAEQRYLAGVESILNGREERALEHFNSVLALDPDHFEALLKAGEVLRTMRRHGEAIEYHRRAARSKEGDLRPLYSLVSDYEESGALDNAKAVLNRIIELNPKRSLTAYRKYRTIAIKENDWEKAWEFQQRVEDLLSETGYSRRAEKKYNLGIRYMLARKLLDGSKVRDAIAILKRLVRTEPAFVPAHLRLGKALAATGQGEDAVGAWEAGYKATAHPIFLSSIEDHYLKEEKPGKAIEALKSALLKSKNEIVPRFFLGKLYYRLEMLDDALREFVRMKSQVAYFPALHYHLAKILERQGSHHEALRELETVLLQTESLKVVYVCGTCARKYSAWVEYCERCGEWNSVVVDFREESAVEDLGMSTAPVYTVKSQEA